MEKKQLLILVSIGIILFIFGLALGIMFEKQGGTQSAKIETANNLSSKVISSIATYGQVKSINNRVVVLSNLGDDLKISVSDNAIIYSLTSNNGGQKTVSFADIKVGDSVNVSVRPMANGELEGLSVIILPTK